MWIILHLVFWSLFISHWWYWDDRVCHWVLNARSLATINGMYSSISVVGCLLYLTCVDWAFESSENGFTIIDSVLRCWSVPRCLALGKGNAPQTTGTITLMGPKACSPRYVHCTDCMYHTYSSIFTLLKKTWPCFMSTPWK